MNKELCFYFIVLLIIYGYFYVEAKLHQRNLLKLPLRIHVNGTRGKSSVTRLIAAGLRAGGYQAFAKTTGTEAKMIFPDGKEEFIKRKGPANIRENIRVINEAVRCGANAIVIECMAVDPDLQWFCEQRMVKSHIGVLTNIREDHEDVMGKGLNNVALALSNTIPAKGFLVTTKVAKELLQTICDKEDIIITSDEQVDSTYLQGFGYEVIPDNVGIALKVCELAGVAPEVAIMGMQHALPDAGNLRITKVLLDKKRVVVINALAANDPESTLWLWEHCVKFTGRVVVLLNCRSDRQYRTAQLCKALSTVHQGSFIVTGAGEFGSALLRELGRESYLLSTNPDFREVVDIIGKWAEEEIIIFAAGNMKGLSPDFLGNLNGG